jgi:hypothetical protein
MPLGRDRRGGQAGVNALRHGRLRGAHQQFETVPQLLREAIETDNPEEREALLLGERNKVLWYRMTVGNGGLFAQCFECMRVCPIATNAPLADPLKRAAAQRTAQSRKVQDGGANAT